MSIKKTSLSDFNVWPSFTDLMLSLLLILFLFLLLSYLVFSSVILNPEVRKNQNSVVASLSSSFPNTYKEIVKDSLYEIAIDNDSLHKIFIINEQHTQKIRFSANILFPQDDFTLQAMGKNLLKIVGQKLKDHLQEIREIQIQGHADPDPTFKFRSNLELASLRALSVFNFLKDTVGIDPSKFLLSATSFGEYKPTSRGENDSSFSWDEIKKANKTIDQKDKNRRIELLIFYKIPL
jgi:flagellar motor protein MotB